MMLLIVVSLGLCGCGGSGLTASPAATTATGKFIDAPVEGLQYVSGGQIGFTGPNGEFTYEVGQPVTFSVGGVVIGQAQGASVITPIELVQTANPGSTVTASTPEVVRIAQFLLTASSLTSTGIKIDPAVSTACAAQNINISTAPTSSFGQAINQIAASAGNRTVITAADAQHHITASMDGLSSGIIVLPPASSTGGGDINSSEVTLNQQFALKIGQSVLIPDEGLRIVLHSVSEDSRCPEDAFCAWEGNARVRLDITKTGQTSTTIELNTSLLAGPQENTYLTYTVKLTSLAPNNKSGQTINPSDYIAGLLITQNGSQSPTAISIDGKQITVESDQYLNLMPQVINPGESTSCSNLIVPAYFSSNLQPFPNNVDIDSVTLSKDSVVVWSGDISKSETRLDAGRLFAIARGCPPPGLQPGTIVEAVFKINYQNSTYFLRAPAAAVMAGS
jgi:hypothetical protein